MEGYKREGKREMIELNMKGRECYHHCERRRRKRKDRENKKSDNGVHEKGR